MLVDFKLLVKLYCIGIVDLSPHITRAAGWTLASGLMVC